MNHINHYEVLGVSQTAPSEVIAAAQIALRQKYNPDNFQEVNEKAEAIAKLQKIDEACAVLLNAEARAKYDSYLAYLADDEYLNNKNPPTAQPEPLQNHNTVAQEPITKAEPLPIQEPKPAINEQPTYKQPKPKSAVRQIIGVLVAIFLLWLIYAIASVGYDFYRMSKQGSEVNPAENIAVNEPKMDKGNELIEIENKKNDDFSQKVAQLTHRLEAKQRKFDNLWQEADAEARAVLMEEQREWELRTRAECQAMAEGEGRNEQRFNELQCLIVKLEARQIQVERYFADFEQQKAELVKQAEIQAQTQSLVTPEPTVEDGATQPVNPEQ